MKKTYQFVVLAALLIVPFVVSTPVSAAFECEVGYTGPDSENNCISEQQYTCSIENDTNITINDTSEQQAVSGSAQINDNRTGGSATTGSAENNNVATYTIIIENGDSEEEVCLASRVIPATEVSETPKTSEEPTPGRGEASAPVQPSQKVTPTALPVTSGSEAPIVLAAFGGIATVAGIAVAYRRLHL